MERLDAALRDAELDPRARQLIEEILRLVRLTERLRDEHPGRLARVEARAEAALGDADFGWRWLRRRHLLLQAVPLDLVASGEEGARHVEYQLAQIERGHPA